jgi:hypothetical protein
LATLARHFSDRSKDRQGGLTYRPYLSTVRPLGQVISYPLNRAASGKRSKVLVMGCERSPAAVQLIHHNGQDKRYAAK